jgi:hypothetical protein
LNTLLLNNGVQDFINENPDVNIATLLLKGSPFEGVSPQELAQQIEARQKSRDKLPTWYRTPFIYYPHKLHIEQTSSEVTARYKSDLVSGDLLVDLTSGFGVDSYFFAKKMRGVVHCETNTELSAIATHNYKILGTENCSCHTGDGMGFLQTMEQQLDWAYLDPSRRNDAKGKVFQLADCLPNVPERLDLLLEKASNILIKTSPLLDLTVGMKELRHVHEIHVVAVRNEVKELLWLLRKDYKGEVLVRTVNLLSPKMESFNFVLSEEKEASLSLGMPGTYLYEPNAAILKSGAFKTLGNRLQLKKLHAHSHLYSSGVLQEFPGRTFLVRHVLAYNKKALRPLGIEKANITTRNFPESVAGLRSRFRIADGGNCYLFFTTNAKDKKIILVCEKA